MVPAHDRVLDELLESLDEIVFPENVKAMQRNWIGRSRGAEIRFPIENSDRGDSLFHNPARHNLWSHLSHSVPRTQTMPNPLRWI